MTLAAGEHEDPDRQEPRCPRELRDAGRHAVAEFGSELDGTKEALERVHCTFDTGFREMTTRLDQLVALVEQSRQLTVRLVAQRRPPK